LQDAVNICLDLGDPSFSRYPAFLNPSFERLQASAQWRTGQLAEESLDVTLKIAQSLINGVDHARHRRAAWHSKSTSK
jgi:hypothetical protein